jgi:hypothetical protein
VRTVGGWEVESVGNDVVTVAAVGVRLGWEKGKKRGIQQGEAGSVR